MIKEVPFIDNVFSLTVTPSNQQIKNVKTVIDEMFQKGKNNLKNYIYLGIWNV